MMLLATSPKLVAADFAGFLTTDAVPRLVTTVRDHYTPYGPIARGKTWRFAELSAPEELDLNYTSSVLPPKSAVRPSREQLFSYADGKLSEALSARNVKPAALLGVHSCDLRALQVLDTVYNEHGPDPYYASARADALIVALACQEPRESCFCLLAGNGPYPEDGYDMLLVPADGGYLVKTATQKGRELAGVLELQPVTGDHVVAGQRRIDSAYVTIEQCNSDFPVPALSVDEAVETSSPEAWDEAAEECLGCGACTTVCPTCFCYDIIDETNLDNTRGSRIRQWDSCLYLRFAQLAAQPAGLELASRLRQRLYHKWVYFTEQFDEPGCVGCGRCIDSCPAQLDPREFLARLRREVYELA